MDFEKTCRLCLATNKQTFDIFSSFNLEQKILYQEMITYCTKVKVKNDDGLPKVICKTCTKQLIKTYTFNLKCEESELKLKMYLESLPCLAAINRQDVGNYEITAPNGLEIKHEKDLKNVFYLEIDNKQEQKVKAQLDQSVDNTTGSINNDTKDDIKIELNCKYEEDSCWDADDDILLDDIKNAKCTEVLEPEEKPKKKRGRRKLSTRTQRVPSKTPHQCDVCGKVLSTSSNLKAHKLCHTDLRPYVCEHCNARFRGHSALLQHRRSHSGETPYHCEYCPKQFGRRSGLVNHVLTHTGEKQYRCEICLKAFAQTAQLNVHLRRHKGDKPYLCHDCGKGFALPSDLRVHQRTHSGEKPYSCHLCTKTFTTTGNLAIHVRIHNKEIRYNCLECGRGFVTSSAYNVHIKRHKGQRDYPCECGKTFYTLSGLKQHRVVHTGEKRYQCKICDKKFSQTSHLSRHFKKDHAKPNLPTPSSDTYKIVLTTMQAGKVVKLFENGYLQKMDVVNENCDASQR